MKLFTSESACCDFRNSKLQILIIFPIFNLEDPIWQIEVFTRWLSLALIFRRFRNSILESCNWFSQIQYSRSKMTTTFLLDMVETFSLGVYGKVSSTKYHLILLKVGILSSPEILWVRKYFVGNNVFLITV